MPESDDAVMPVCGVCGDKPLPPTDGPDGKLWPRVCGVCTPEPDGSARPVIDPTKIPQHVVDAARKVFLSTNAPHHDLHRIIAAALATLMDDEPVRGVPEYDYTYADVLAAVLARESRP